MKVDVITDSGDLAAAQSQKETMARAKRTLETATAEVVRTNPGYRAVSAMPGLRDGRPVVEVFLVNGTDARSVGAVTARPRALFSSSALGLA